MTPAEASTHQDRVNFGERARNFLVSREYTDIVKPIIDSMIRGVTDVRALKKSEFSTDIKAQALILGHQITAEYLEKIEVLINAFVQDGEVSRKILEKQRQPEAEPLFKTEEE